MSGVFLIVAHDDQYENPTVLRSTKGGYPHITLFYSGKSLSQHFLSKLGYETLNSLTLLPRGEPRFTLTSENAKLNSFFHERQGKQRYDVLLHLSDEDKELIEELRVIVNPQIGATALRDISMGPPHVTHSIHWIEAEAQAALEEVKKHLPLEITITGYTID